MAERHALVVSTEYLRVESLPKSLAEQLYVKPAWRYKAVPLTLGYSYALVDPNRRIVPLVGIGVSCFLGSVKQLDGSTPSMLHSGEGLATTPRLSFQEHKGIGYGAEATLGVRADLHRYVFVQAQGRARYVNGLAFTSGDYDIRSAFAKIDFSIGFGFKF